MCLFRHQWSRWSLFRRSYKGHNYQFRACKVCGLGQWRSIGYCDGVKTAEINEALVEVGTHTPLEEKSDGSGSL